MKLLAIDPSLVNIGIVAGTLDEKGLRLHKLYHVQTEKSKAKTIRVSSDTIARCRRIDNFVKDVMTEENPDFVFGETPSGSQNAKAMMSYGVVCMLLASLPIPLFEVTPIEVKMASVGKKTASKQEIITWASSLYPHLNWIKKKGVLLNVNEHLADAVAIIHAGLASSDFKKISNILLP